MKINIQNKVKKESLTEILQKTVDASKKVATNTKENVVSEIEKSKKCSTH